VAYSLLTLDAGSINSTDVLFTDPSRDYSHLASTRNPQRLAFKTPSLHSSYYTFRSERDISNSSFIQLPRPTSQPHLIRTQTATAVKDRGHLDHVCTHKPRPPLQLRITSKSRHYLQQIEQAHLHANSSDHRLPRPHDMRGTSRFVHAQQYNMLKTSCNPGLAVMDPTKTHKASWRPSFTYLQAHVVPYLPSYYLSNTTVIDNASSCNRPHACITKVQLK
jgi:hypothetical protein